MPLLLNTSGCLEYWLHICRNGLLLIFYLHQEWIHTGFHCFTKIGQNFINKFIFTEKNFPSWNLVNILSDWLRNPGKISLGSENPKKFQRGSCLQTPIEACTFSTCLRNQSVPAVHLALSIYQFEQGQVTLKIKFTRRNGLQVIFCINCSIHLSVSKG